MVPLDSRPRCGVPGMGRGVRIAVRSALYADAFSATGAVPWAGRAARPPVTGTNLPDPVLLGTVFMIACETGGLPPSGAALANPAPGTMVPSAMTADRRLTRRNPSHSSQTSGRALPAYLARSVCGRNPPSRAPLQPSSHHASHH